MYFDLPAIMLNLTNIVITTCYALMHERLKEPNLSQMHINPPQIMQLGLTC